MLYSILELLFNLIYMKKYLIIAMLVVSPLFVHADTYTDQLNQLIRLLMQTVALLQQQLAEQNALLASNSTTTPPVYNPSVPSVTYTVPTPTVQQSVITIPQSVSVETPVVQVEPTVGSQKSVQNVPSIVKDFQIQVYREYLPRDINSQTLTTCKVASGNFPHVEKCDEAVYWDFGFRIQYLENGKFPTNIYSQQREIFNITLKTPDGKEITNQTHGVENPSADFGYVAPYDTIDYTVDPPIVKDFQITVSANGLTKTYNIHSTVVTEVN